MKEKDKDKDKTYDKTYSSELPIPEPEQIAKRKVSKMKYFLIFSPVLGIGLLIYYFVVLWFKLYSLITILVFLFTIPIFLVNIATFFLTLFKLRRKIRNKVYPVFTKNYINAIFLTNNKRKIEFLAIINEDGFSFDLGKRSYLIDKNALFQNEKNESCSYYLPELPNPLIFDFEKGIMKFIEAINKGNPREATDFKGNIIDISYSSTNLQVFKKDKIFGDLHKNPENDKIVLGALTFCGICVLFIFILAIIK